jgi:predicted ATPase
MPPADTMKSTKWVVITGAPCSGKTSMIRELERRGFRVKHEVARALIDAALARGRSLEEIRADEEIFEGRILTAKVEIEKSLPPEALIFLDRAIPDSIAYFTHAHLDPTTPIRESRLYRYRQVFFFERLQIKKDAVRIEDEAAAKRLEQLLWQSYRDLGYQPVRVPLMPLTGRCDWVLSHL